MSSFFPVKGVRQGCVLAPSLFNICMDWVLGSFGLKSLWSTCRQHPDH